MGTTASVIPGDSEATRLLTHNTSDVPDRNSTTRSEIRQGQSGDTGYSSPQDMEPSLSSSKDGILVTDPVVSSGQQKSSSDHICQAQRSEGHSSREENEVAMKDAGANGVVVEENDATASSTSSSAGASDIEDRPHRPRREKRRSRTAVETEAVTDPSHPNLVVMSERTPSPPEEPSKPCVSQQAAEPREDEVEENDTGPGPESISTLADAATCTKRHDPCRRNRCGSRQKGESPVTSGLAMETSTSTSSDADRDKLTLLREYMPYFGSGDTGRDNMVKSILSSVDSQELAEECDEYKNTLLILACQYRCHGLVRLILARGDQAVNVNAVNSAGACALHFSCYKDSICAQSAELLLERGAMPEVVESTYG